MTDKKVLESQERQRQATAARTRFEKATREIASERRFGGPEAASTEIEVLEEATRLVNENSRG